MDVRIERKLETDELEFVSQVQGIVRKYREKDKSLPEILVSEKKLYEIWSKANSTVGQYCLDSSINYYKEAGVLSYWLRKLKPLQTNDHPKLHMINETLALHFAISYVSAKQRKGVRVLQTELEQSTTNKKRATEIEEILNGTIERQKSYLKILHKMEPEIVKAFRYFNVATGNIPLILEAIMRAPVDEVYAFSD